MKSEVYNVEPSNIYCADCLDIMPKIADKSVDCILCDLPYQVLNKNNPNAQWDRIIPFEPLWEQYERIIKNNGAILLFAQGMFTAQLMMSNPKLWRYNLIWSKGRVTGFLNANRMPMRCHEDICVFYKKLPTYIHKWKSVSHISAITAKEIMNHQQIDVMEILFRHQLSFLTRNFPKVSFKSKASIRMESSIIQRRNPLNSYNT